MRIWRDYRAGLADASVENDSVARAVRKFMAGRDSWEGDAEELLKGIEWEGAGDKQWPTTTAHLSNRLRRAAPTLRATGIEIEMDRQGARNRRRIIGIKKSAEQVGHA